MFWLILFIVSVIILLIGDLCFSTSSFWEDCCAIFTICLVISIVILIIAIPDGLTDYVSLKRDYTQVQIYRDKLKDVKEAYYKYNTNSNKQIVNGSIENMNQSTNVSNFILELASIESKYFSYLEKCKAYKEESCLYWFGNGCFISDKIYELPTK